MQVDAEGLKVRPNHTRCTVILREISENTQGHEVEVMKIIFTLSFDWTGLVVERFQLQNNRDYKYLANFTTSSSNRIPLREVIFSIRIDYY